MSAFDTDFINYINSVPLCSRALTEHSGKSFCLKCECCNLITCYRIHGESFLWLLKFAAHIGHVSTMAVIWECSLVGVLLLFWCGFFIFNFILNVAASLLFYLCLLFCIFYIWGFGKPVEGGRAFFNTQLL